MKKLILLLCFTAPLWSIAQSATILPNSLSVPKVSSMPTCNTTEKGTQVLNTTDNKMYYCNGTNWQEMTGGGFTLPYSGTVNGNSTLLYLENTGIGRVIHAKSTDFGALRGESETNIGVHGSSTSYYGVNGTSISSVGVRGSSASGTGVYGISTTGYGGYFSASGNQPTLYVYTSQGEAADFRGNVKIRDELIVDDNKGIVRSSNSEQQKIVKGTIHFLASNLAVGAYVEGTYNYENFGDTPIVTVGQIQNVNSTGEWYKVMVIPMNVTSALCTFRLVNVGNNAITFNAYWSILIVGPE
ncbi:hypothetical protein [Emticicia agri]|uniref:Uncharacterized protein n=1 Tax=Emticicia agri TaxID=2492393 RepID=A0A4Q5LY11_9BACT|nr:hypothetical protein [Emticicia agri]RYU94457.1 hypothetical protein EWM59_16795 [Emticicia agri]